MTTRYAAHSLRRLVEARYASGSATAQLHHVQGHDPFREAEAAVFRDEAATWRDVAEHLRREDWGAATAWLQEHGQRRRGGAGRILAIARSQVLANSSGISTL